MEKFGKFWSKKFFLGLLIFRAIKIKMEFGDWHLAYSEDTDLEDIRLAVNQNLV